MQAFAEADAFFCFVELLSGFRDNFVQQLDNSVVGIRSTITKLSQLLRKHDEELWRHLEITSKVRDFKICIVYRYSFAFSFGSILSRLCIYFELFWFFKLRLAIYFLFAFCGIYCYAIVCGLCSLLCYIKFVK